MISIFLFLLPGLLLFRLLRLRKNIDLLETSLFGAGMSLSLISLIAFLSFLFRLSISAAVIMFYLLCFLLAVLAFADWLMKRRRSEGAVTPALEDLDGVADKRRQNPPGVVAAEEESPSTDSLSGISSQNPSGSRSAKQESSGTGSSLNTGLQNPPGGGSAEEGSVENTTTIGIEGLTVTKSADKQSMLFPSISERGSLYLPVLSLIALAAVVLMAQRLEMPPLGQEDGVLLMMAQKIRSLPALSIDNLYFRPGTVFAYIVPLYSFLLALLSSLSGMEVVQLYCLSRGFLAFLSIAAVYGIAKALFPSARNFPWFVVLFSCAAIWSGWGNDFTAQAFGQFLSFPQYQDVALAVLLPMAFFFFLNALREEGKAITALCVIVTSLLLFIHAREYIVAIMLYTAALCGLLISGRERAAAVRAALIIALLVIAGIVLYRFQSGMVAPGVQQWNRTAAAALLDQGISAVKQEGPLRLFHPPLRGRQLLPGYNMVLLNPLYLMAVFLVPFFLLKRHERGLSMLAVVLFGVFASASVPVLTLILLRFSYSQFLVGAPATLGLFPFVFIACAWALWQLCALIARLPAIYRLLFFLIPFILVIPQWIYRWSPAVFSIWTLAVPVLLVVFQMVRAARKPAGGPSSGDLASSGAGEADVTGSGVPAEKGAGPAFLILLVCSAFLIACDDRVFIQPCGFSPRFPVRENSVPLERKTLFDEFRYACSQISVSNWIDWYQKGPYRALSLPVVDFMRRNVPAGSVFAAPGECLMAISVMTPQHVYMSGSYISLMAEPHVLEDISRMRTGLSFVDKVRDDRDFREEVLQRGNRQALSDPAPLQIYAALTVLIDEMMTGRLQPFFNASDSPEIRKRMLEYFDIDYLMVTEKWRKAFESTLKPLADELEMIYDDGRSAIYRVKKRKLPLKREKLSAEGR